MGLLLRPTAPIAVLIALLLAPPATAGDAAEPDVAVELIADRPALGPDGAWIGARLQAPEGWHVYWENPGEAGLDTTAAFAAGGAAIGPVRYPGPEAFLSPGEIRSYGYHGPVALLAEVAPLQGAPDGDVTITAEVAWLACRAVCVPGRATVERTLPRSAAAVPPASPDPLARDKRRLPRPLEELPGATVAWLDDDGGPVAEVTLPGVTAAEAFPTRPLEARLRELTIARDDAGVTVTIRLSEGPAEAGRLVLGLGSDRFVELPLVVPSP